MVSNRMKEALQKLEDSVKKIQPFTKEDLQPLVDVRKEIERKFPTKGNRNKKRP